MTLDQIIPSICIIVLVVLAVTILMFIIAWVFLKIIDIGLTMVSDAWFDLTITWRDITPVKIVKGEKE